MSENKTLSFTKFEIATIQKLIEAEIEYLSDDDTDIKGSQYAVYMLESLLQKLDVE